jgi:hypothetical protein
VQELLLIVTEARAVSRQAANAALLAGEARWRETGRVADDWRRALMQAEL